MNDHDLFREAMTYLAALVAGLSLMQVLPAIASLFSVVWLGINIWEKTTGKSFSQTKIATWLTK